jgi:hypothetical protein
MRASARIRNILCLLFFTSTCLASAASARAGDGAWSPFAVSVPARRNFSVPSPDRARTIIVSNMELSVLEGGYPAPGAEGLGILLPAEIMWSPDAKSFVITSSDGGPTGTWDASLLFEENGRFAYYSITGDAIDLFLKEYPCTSPLLPNAGALKYLKPSKQLLLAVEAPMASSCGTHDAVRGYIVDLPSGAVVKELYRKDLLEDWSEALGPRFGPLLRKERRH